AAGLTRRPVGIFLDAVIGMIEPVESHFMWRPQLRDPADELVLEAAVNGQAKALDIQPEGFWRSPGAIRHRLANTSWSDTEDQDMKNQSTYPLRLPRSV